MPAAVIAQGTIVTPPPPDPGGGGTTTAITLLQPLTGVASIVYPWGVLTTNAIVTGTVADTARFTGTVL